MPLILGSSGKALGCFVTEKARNDVQDHVHARGDAGSGDDVAVVDPAGFGHPIDVGSVSGDLTEQHLVGRGAAAIEQAGGGEEVGAVTDGSRQFSVGGALA